MTTVETVSAIVPVYNGEPFIAAALDSIARQRDLVLETIVIDDGSDDGSAVVVQNHELDTVYGYQENQGAQHARNRGLALARGEFVTFLDADDLWADNKLACQLALIEEYDVVVGHSRLLDDDDRPFLFLNVAAALFRRSVFERLGEFDADLSTTDDLDWFFRAREQGVRICIHDDIVLYHRRHGNNLTLRSARRNQSEILRTLHKSLARRRAEGSLSVPQFSSLR